MRGNGTILAMAGTCSLALLPATPMRNLHGYHRHSHAPWVVNRVLNVPRAASLCASHAAARFVASVRGYIEATFLQGPGGGWVGRLYRAPDARAFYFNDTKPFIQVWGTKAWSVNLSGRRVTFHGTLTCDAAKNDIGPPGWRASMTPDRYWM